MGYHRAGFEVYGIDNKPQPRYPFPFLLMDAMEAMDRLLQGKGLTFSNGETLYLKDFDAYHASPPCQHASKIAKMNRSIRPGKYIHPNLIPAIRIRLIATGKPYVIENPVEAHLENPIILCGSSFGLNLRRHRAFETNMPVVLMPPCSHSWQKPRFRSLDHNRRGLTPVIGVHGNINYHGEMELRKEAMGINWMINKELTQAIPPAYTEYIGKYLLADIEMRRTNEQD